MDDEEKDFRQFECRPICAEALARVIMRDEAFKAFVDLEERPRARLVRVMQLWSKGMALTPEQFNGNEGRCQRGSINRLLQAFKTHGIRIYGFTRRLVGKKTFVIVDVDPAKKQKRADQGILNRAKDRVIYFEAKYGGQDE
ncbi:MAG TPA: hypothetical protein VGU01_05610 [Sphingomicrobium sp.]|nr:hypothetical protein [Sphingomicrobium sp.]